MPSARTMTRSSISWLAIVIGPLTRSSQVTTPRSRVAKADHRRDALGHRRQRLARLGAPAAVVARLLAARALRLAHRVELGRRAVAAVGPARGEHRARRPRGSGRGAASGRSGLRRSRGRASASTSRIWSTDVLRRARDVGVLDAQDEVAAVVAREGPREQRRARGAEVQEAGRRRRDAGADALPGRICGSACEVRSQAARPRARSALMSSTSSRPTATRIRPCVMPAAWRCSSVSRPCEVLAGWVIVVLVSPRLAVIEQTCGASITWKAFARAASRRRRPRR